MRKIFFFLLGTLSLIMAGCSSQETPQNLLNVPDMVDILTEFHLAEAAITRENMSVKDREVRRHYYQDVILKEKEVDREAFFQSYHYYLTRPELIDTIYSRMIDDLNQLVPVEQEKRFKQKEKEKTKPKWKIEREARLNQQKEAAKKK